MRNGWRFVIAVAMVVVPLALGGCGQRSGVRSVPTAANAQEARGMDKVAALDAARRYISACSNHDQTAIRSLISLRAKSQGRRSLVDEVLINNAGNASISPDGLTYELKSVEEVTCWSVQKEWRDFPLTWVKVNSPGAPSGLHLLFLGENGEWKIVDMF